MATVKYHGEFPADQEHIVHHEIRFERGAEVRVYDEAVLAKLRSNRFFEVSEAASENRNRVIDGLPDLESGEVVVTKRGPGRPKKEA